MRKGSAHSTVALGPRHAKRYKSGKQIKVRIDPRNPEAIALA